MKGSDYQGDVEYAESRLTGTIVRYQGEPAFVNNVTYQRDRPVAVLRYISPRADEAVPLDDLDLSPFNLGYVNYRNIASFLTRVPMRGDYRQGLRTHNMYSHFGYHHQSIPISGIYNTLMNVFPTFRQCVVAVQATEQSRSSAWHLNWALDREGNIRHRFGDIVGSLVSGRPVLLDRLSHLQEQLEDTM